MPSKNDSAWQRYLNAKGYDLNNGGIYTVDAEELKDLAEREPRLLAKFDEPHQLPEPLAQAGYTLLPIRNGRYTLFQGNLFVPVTSCPQLQIFTGQAPFRLETLSRGKGESQYIDQAYIIGVLSDFVGVPLSDLFLTVRGRERTCAFEFSFNGHDFNVEGVQIEVDAGYEGPRDIFLIEAKIGVPGHFNIRQLYYPFRHFRQLVPTKNVRPIFLSYDLAANQYHLQEVSFQDINNPGSWHFPKCKVYQLQSVPVSHIDELIDVSFHTETNIAPQADDLNKIVELIDFIENGYQTAQDVADAFGFDIRQSNYYREAAQYLGLVEVRENIFQLTPRGQQLFYENNLQETRRLLALCIINSWIFTKLIDRARDKSNTDKTFQNADIDKIIASVKKYGGETIPRRRRTIVAWIRWMSEQFRCFEIQGSDYLLK